MSSPEERITTFQLLRSWNVMKKKASDKLYQMGIKGEYFCTKILNGFESYFNGPFVFFSVQAVVVAVFFCGPEFHLQCLPIELMFGSLTDTYIEGC